MSDISKFQLPNGNKYDIKDAYSREYKADIDSPEFTGTPTAPTMLRGNKSNSIATTEFVNNEFEKVVKWDNAESGTTTTVTTNMVVLTESEYEALTTIIPNTFYFIYEDETEVTSYDL